MRRENDPDDSVRVRAVEALGRLRAREGVPAMIALSRNPEWHARHQAVIALGQVKDHRSIEALAERCDDRRLTAYLAAAYLAGFKDEAAKAAFERGQRGRPRPVSAGQAIATIASTSTGMPNGSSPAPIAERA